MKSALIVSDEHAAVREGRVRHRSAANRRFRQLLEFFTGGFGQAQIAAVVERQQLAVTRRDEAHMIISQSLFAPQFVPFGKIETTNIGTRQRRLLVGDDDHRPFRAHCSRRKIAGQIVLPPRRPGFPGSLCGKLKRQGAGVLRRANQRVADHQRRRRDAGRMKDDGVFPPNRAVHGRQTKRAQRRLHSDLGVTLVPFAERQRDGRRRACRFVEQLPGELP